MAHLDLSFLPLVDAVLNGIAATLLVIGLMLIRRRRVVAHRNVMISAFAVSMLFLVSYLTHQWWRQATGQPLHTEFNAHGLVKGAYLIMLASHIILASTVPIFAITLITLGLRGKFHLHRRIARWGYPIWMYVSVTGVLIYLLLYPLNPPVLK